jgi:hypothetical protein
MVISFPADHDPGVEGALHQLEQLVGLPDQGHHRLVVRHEILTSVVVVGFFLASANWARLGRVSKTGRVAAPDDQYTRRHPRRNVRSAGRPAQGAPPRR